MNKTIKPRAKGPIRRSLTGTPNTEMCIEGRSENIHRITRHAWKRGSTDCSAR